jgi:peptidoglycan/LPS O-acetylase OafA/YrhL
MLAAVGIACIAIVAATVGIGSPDRGLSSLVLLAVNIVGMAWIGMCVTRAGSRWLAPLRWAPFTYLGQISYGLYLYHYIILMISAGRLRLWAPWEMPPGRLLLSLVLCLFTASLSWRLIERPILRLKARYEYGRAGRELSSRQRGLSHTRQLQDRSSVDGKLSG